MFLESRCSIQVYGIRKKKCCEIPSRTYPKITISGRVRLARCVTPWPDRISDPMSDKSPWTALGTLWKHKSLLMGIWCFVCVCVCGFFFAKFCKIKKKKITVERCENNNQPTRCWIFKEKDQKGTGLQQSGKYEPGATENTQCPQTYGSVRNE